MRGSAFRSHVSPRTGSAWSTAAKASNIFLEQDGANDPRDKARRVRREPRWSLDHRPTTFDDRRLRDRWMKREVREALSDVRDFGLAPYDIMNS